MIAEIEERGFCVEGDVVVRALAAGRGRPLVLLSGWSQSSAMFLAQIEAFASDRAVLALDHRGHGISDRPAGGYRVQRLAADLHAVLEIAALESVTLLGHSMGASVIRAYLDIYGDARIADLVLVDQMARALADPTWTEEECREIGATISADDLFAFTNGLCGTDGERVRVAFLEAVTSPGIDDDALAFLARENAKFPLSAAAVLLFDNATRDWRDFDATIRLPTLVVAGNSVNVPIESQRRIHREISGSRFEVVEASSGGTHFPFLENPQAFNRSVSEFLAERP